MNLRNNFGPASWLIRAHRIQLLVIILAGLFSLNARAFNTSLQPEEIQEAYSLGQTTNHEELADFLNKYEHDFKPSSDNSAAFVQSVEFQTPYEQIVLRSLHNMQYTKFQAGEDYQANRDLVIVRVLVGLKTGYTGREPPADRFQVVVSQGKAIQPRNLNSTVLCNPLIWNEAAINTDCMTYQREIKLQFDAVQFAPGSTTIKVVVPYGQPQETRYNLDNLK